MSLYNVYTYFSEDAPENMQWRAEVYLKDGMSMGGIYGRDREDVRSRATVLMDNEFARQKKLTSGYSNVSENSEARKPTSPAPAKGGRGAQFIGKTWVMNINTREKKRVMPSEADAMVASGAWIKAGPRSK
jgi:hypothetical protein